jgi:hypothetical protein
MDCADGKRSGATEITVLASRDVLDAIHVGDDKIMLMDSSAYLSLQPGSFNSVEALSCSQLLLECMLLALLLRQLTRQTVIRSDSEGGMQLEKRERVS